MDQIALERAISERDRLECHRAQEAEMSMMRCSECDRVCDTDDGTGEWLGDDYICEGCVEDLSVECATCGDYFLPRDGETTCEGCRNEQDGGEVGGPAAG